MQPCFSNISADIVLIICLRLLCICKNNLRLPFEAKLLYISFVKQVIYDSWIIIIRIMTCEALVIGSVAGLALTAAILSFQVLTDRKTSSRESLKKENIKQLTTDTFTV